MPAPPQPMIAFLLGFLVPGLGHLYIKQQKKALLIFLGAAFTCCGLGFFNLLAGIDAAMLARRVVAGHTLGEWETSGLANALDNL